ncbi:MAG: HK97 family phage prohead protease [Chloroflexi bacterium]|nr:HK97 family phage prohead protease [Chloroflexota bacterium]
MLTEYPAFAATLEVRQGENGRRSFTGSFPYGVTATRSNSGRTRKERFASGSLAWQVVEFQKLQAELSKVLGETFDEFQQQAVLQQRADIPDLSGVEPARRARIEELSDAIEKRNTHLLTGHSYDHALADMLSGTLAVEHTPERIFLRADLPPIEESPSWVNDAVLGINGGQLRGISPGFQVPAATGRERLIPEPGNAGIMIREIQDGVAYEYSLVSRPTYPLTDIDMRSDDLVLPRRRRYWL